jgi:hypothetical protein
MYLCVDVKSNSKTSSFTTHDAISLTLHHEVMISTGLTKSLAYLNNFEILGDLATAPILYVVICSDVKSYIKERNAYSPERNWFEVVVGAATEVEARHLLRQLPRFQRDLERSSYNLDLNRDAYGRYPLIKRELPNTDQPDVIEFYQHQPAVQMAYAKLDTSHPLYCQLRWALMHSSHHNMSIA